MQTENVSKVVDSLTNNFFVAAGVNYASFQKNRPVVPSEYAHYVHPFQLSEEIRQLKTNLASLVCSPHDPSMKIETLSKEYMESVLILEAPRKVIQFGAAATESKPKPAPRAVKPAKTRVRVVNVGPIVNDRDVDEEAVPPPRPVIVAAPVVKRARVGGTGMPANFYQIVPPFFHEFWTKEFHDASVNYAFFANITSKNCVEFGLPVFAEKPSSLAVINEKLSQRKYTTKEEFEYDFQLMFTNIHRYYPENHPAVAAAREMQATFETRWATLESQFKW